MSVVLDSSALLAAIWDEPGAERVEPLIESARVSAVNLAEVVTRLVDKGAGEAEVASFVRSFGADVVPFDADMALAAGLLRRRTRAAGLSLGDRACLALAASMGLPAVTADRAWAGVDAGVEVELIR